MCTPEPKNGNAFVFFSPRTHIGFETFFTKGHYKLEELAFMTNQFNLGYLG